MTRIRHCGNGFCLMLVESRFHPGTKAWKLVRVEEVKTEVNENV